MTRWLSDTDFAAVVDLATRAPSMHNTQPWRFRQRDRAVEVLLDPARRLPVADPSGWGARVSCGAALFNLRLALVLRGTPGRVEVMPDPADPYLLARVRPEPRRSPLPSELRLHRVLPLRHSNRMPFLDKPVPADVRTALIAAARTENAHLALVHTPPAVETVAELVRDAQRDLDARADYEAELASWTRSDGRATDGIPRAAGGPAPSPGELLARRHFGDTEHAGQFSYETEPLLAVLGTASDWPADQVQAGQALQRVLLTATDLGLAASMFSQPIEVRPVRDRLRLALTLGSEPQMLLRFGYALAAPRSPRRPVADVMEA